MNNYKYIFLAWMVIVHTILLSASYWQPIWKNSPLFSQPYLSNIKFWDWNQYLANFGFSNIPIEKTKIEDVKAITNNFSLEDSLTHNLSDQFTDGGFGGLIDLSSVDSIVTDTLSINQIENPFVTTNDENIVNNTKTDKKAQYLDTFFASLVAMQQQQNAGNDSLIRILHYGDSQIEGDRITKHLRKYFQRDFGGYGYSYIPVLEQATHHAFTRKISGYWNKYSVFQNKYKNGKYGASGCVFRYQKQLNDADIKDFIHDTQSPTLNAGIEIKFPYTRAKYDHLKILWGNAPVAFEISGRNAKDSLVFEQKMPAQTTHPQFSVLPYPVDPKGFKLKFSSSISPDIYGIYLESKSGVQVDNYALRGHSGNFLALMNETSVAQQLELLHTKLIIFQYGGNIVPYNSPNFNWYEADLYRMIEKFKRMAPNASIIVMAVADAGYRKKGEIIPYPSASQIRQAQQRAANRAGVAFWDLYNVMGGAGSVVAWANQRPALLGHDCAHFTEYGQQLVAKMFYSAFMKSYKTYIHERMPNPSRNYKNSNP